MQLYSPVNIYVAHGTADKVMPFDGLDDERVTYTRGRRCNPGGNVQLVEWHEGTHVWPQEEIRIGEQLVAFFKLDQ